MRWPNSEGYTPKETDGKPHPPKDAGSGETDSSRQMIPKGRTGWFADRIFMQKLKVVMDKDEHAKIRNTTVHQIDDVIGVLLEQGYLK